MTEIVATRHRHRGAGVASVTTIRPLRTAEVASAPTQGTLALRFAPAAPAVHRAALPMPSRRRRELDAFAGRFSAGLVEVLGGDRGPQQLLRWTSADVYEELVERAHALAGTAAGDQRLRRLRAQIRSVHLFCPSATSAELSIHVRHGHRSRAIAARLEYRDERWVCVALQLG